MFCLMQQQVHVFQEVFPVHAEVKATLDPEKVPPFPRKHGCSVCTLLKMEPVAEPRFICANQM